MPDGSFAVVEATRNGLPAVLAVNLALRFDNPNRVAYSGFRHACSP